MVYLPTFTKKCNQIVSIYVYHTWILQASNKQIRDFPFKEREKQWASCHFFSGPGPTNEVPGIAACPAVTCEDACGLSDSSSQYQDPTNEPFPQSSLWNGMDVMRRNDR